MTCRGLGNRPRSLILKKFRLVKGFIQYRILIRVEHWLKDDAIVNELTRSSAHYIEQDLPNYQ